MGLFGLGGGGARKAAQPYMNQANTSLGQARNVGGQLGTLASGYGGLASLYGGQERGAVQNYADNLSRGTTETQRSALVGGMLGNADHNYLQGQSNLTANLAARGLGNSGNAAGGLMGLEAARAGAVTNAGNQANLYADQLRTQNLGQLNSLYGGLENQYAGRQTGLLGQQAGIYGNAAGQYSNLGQQAANYAQQDEQAQLAAIQGLVSTAGQIYGMASGGGADNGGSPMSNGGFLTRSQPAQPVMPQEWQGQYIDPSRYPIAGYRR
jgi:hypothetical protein